MHRASGVDFKSSSLAHQIRKSVEELKCADALKVLFDCHKNDITSWVVLKNYLLRTAFNHREFSLISLLIECSSKSDLSQSSNLIPGVNQLRID
jgi:hypothetical protein